MPQMSPLNWLILMISFIMILFIYSNLNFFIFVYKKKSLKSLKFKSKLNWKW